MTVGRASVGGKAGSVIRGVFLIAATIFMATAAAAPATVRVGVYSNPPKVAFDREGRPSGIYALVIEDAARRESWAVQYIAGTFQEGLSRLERGEVDIMVDVAYTPERGQRFDFGSEPVLNSWNEVYARRKLNIRYMSELHGRRVGVLNGSVQEALFRDAAGTWGVRPILVRFDTFEDAFAAAENGQVDAVVSNPFFATRRGGDLSQTAIVFGSYSLHYASRKGHNSQLLAALDRRLVVLKADPTSVYSREFELLVRGQRPAVLPVWVHPVAAAGLLLLTVLLGWAASARRAARRLSAAESEQRQLAEQRMQLLRDAEKREQMLQQANEDLQIMSYSLSHDLRAPLAAVHGFVSAVRDSGGDALDSRVRRLLDRSLAAARRMDDMVRDLGAMLRIAGQPLNLQDSDLTLLAHDVIEGLRSHQQGQPEVIIAQGLTAPVDPQMMRVAFENLLGNAWKFSSLVERPTIELGQFPDRTTYYVRDNGAGFPMEHSARLFQPFSRLHAHDEFSGSGMGLSIVKRVITRHGGKVWAEAEVGKGATFYFTLDHG